MSLILDGSVGVSDVDGSAATPAIRGTDANTGMFFPAADTIAFSEGGVESMRLNSSGVLVTTNDASISGLTVGKGGGALGTNTAVGGSALSANTTGQYNTGIGYVTANSITTGEFNTAVGMVALRYNQTGANNTATGYAALQGVSGNSHSNNSAFGFLALVGNTTGGSNTAVGSQALISNTTASNNTAVGYQAGYSNTTGGSNSAFGYQALYTNTTGVINTALGYSALYSNTTGNFNIAVGQDALKANTTASYQTAVGYQAGYTNSGGEWFGTYLGYRAGYTSTGAGNTFIGSDAGYLVSSGSKNSILGRYDGNQGGLDIRTASNYIVLSDGDGNPRGIFDNSGNFRLGGAAFAVGTDGISLKANGTLLSNCNGDWNQELSGSQTGRIRFFSSNGTSTQVGTITVNTTNTAYNTSSDYRLKENIAPMTGALAKVSALKPCTYTWKVDGSEGQGFIAHELAEVVPQAVTGEKDAVNEDGSIKPQGIDTSFLVATLTAAIQELKAEFDAYKATHP